MTKLRAPLSIDAALARIAGQLPGAWAEMATITERAEHTVRAWGDPDKPEAIALPSAILLDVAYRRAGGVGAPIRDAYDALFDHACVEEFGDQIELGHALMGVIKEVGEAEVAIFAATLPGATDEVLAVAEREAEQGLATLTTAHATVKRLRKRRGQDGPPAQGP